MKKRLALLIGVLLVATLVFAACSQPAETVRQVRWAESETHTFKITLSDFAESESKLFNSYTKKVLQNGDGEELTEKDVTCYKDDMITSSESLVMANGDQIRPVDADGTFTLSIKQDTPTTWKLETHQVIYSQYETETLQKLDCLDTLKECVAKAEENPFTNNDGRTTLRSETNSTVIFANDATQLPVSSVSENRGFYIGKIAQAVSNYKYETTYDFSKKKVSVKLNDGEAEERSISGNCIDANQFLLYVRSFDKSSAAFKNNPSVAVYDVTTNSVTTAAFALNRQFNLILANGEETVIPVNTVLSTVGGIPFMAQYNLPDMTTVGEGHDFLPESGSKRCKYTTVKFRSGWYSYELQLDEGLQQAVNAIKLNIVTE